MKKTDIDANVSYFGGEVKVHFFIDGKDYAFRCNKNDLETLLHKEMEVIKKVSF